MGSINGRPIQFIGGEPSGWVRDIVLSKALAHADSSIAKSSTAMHPIRVLIYSSLDAYPSASIQALIARCRPEVLIHLSDEKLRHRSASYKQARIVFRSYFNPNLLRRNVFFIPIGYNEDLVHGLSRPRDPIERSVSWCFFGNEKGDRRRMLEVFRLIPNGIWSLGRSGFMKNLEVTNERLGQLMVDSHFVLCPFGSLAPDTWRIMETLEAGAIPVTIKMRGVDYFQFIYGHHPFVVADSWFIASQEIEALLRNKELLRERHQQVESWYRDFKENLSDDVAKILQGKSSELSSPQFKLQRNARRSLRVRFFFWSFFHLPPVRKSIITWLDYVRSFFR